MPDSRTVLGALLAANVKVEAVTQTFPGMDRTDLDVAKAISAQFGIPHHVIIPQKFDDPKLQAWKEHTGQSFNDLDMHWFPLGLWRFLRPGDLFLKGGCFEGGRRFYGTDVPLTFETATGSRIMEYLRASHGADVLDEWLNWRGIIRTVWIWWTRYIWIKSGRLARLDRAGEGRSHWRVHPSGK